MTLSVTAVTDKRHARRVLQYGARHVLWGISHDRRRQGCGKLPCSSDGVALKVSEDPQGVRRAGWCGLATCGSVWACPVCSAKIASVRQGEVLAAVTEWERRGGRVALGTVTMRHSKKDALGVLWDGLAAARTAMISGRAWVSEQVEHGTAMPRTIKSGKRKGEVVNSHRVPIISEVEATYGDNGWHLHIHMLLFLGAGATDESLALLGAQMFTRWRTALGAAGLPLPSFKRGQDWELAAIGSGAALADYFTKGIYDGEAPEFAREAKALKIASRRGLAAEVTRADFKDAARGGRTPFGILRSLVQVVTSGDMTSITAQQVETDENLWHDWERASRRRQQMSWSAGLREYLGRALPVEVSDEDAAAAEPGGVTVERAKVDGPTHRLIVACRADGRLLNAYESGSVQGRSLLAVFEQGADMLVSGVEFAEAARTCRVLLRGHVRALVPAAAA